jgi:hypothetical protein
MAKPSYLPLDTYRNAMRAAFDDRAERDIWKLSTDSQWDADIGSLADFAKPLEMQAMPEADPLPIVVSERPDAMQIREQQQTRSTAMPTIPQADGMVVHHIDGRQQPQAPSMQPGEQMGNVEMATGPATAAPTGPAPERAGEYRAYARAVAQQYGVDPDIFERQINQESGFRPWGDDGKPLGSSAGAQGIAQFMPATAAGYGVDVNDPYSSLEGAARHMRDLLKANNGNYRYALAAYNAGQGAVNQYGDGVFEADFAHGQTRDYVNIILGPQSSAPTMQRVSLTATPPSPSGASVAAPSPAAAGASPPPAAAPPAPWANETGGGQMMMKDSGTEDFLPGDGGTAPTSYEQPYTPDDGPREATPGSVGSQPLPQTPNPMTYGPIQQGDVAEGPPTLGDVTMQNGGEPTEGGQWYPMETRPIEAQRAREQGPARPIGASMDAEPPLLAPTAEAVRGGVRTLGSNLAQGASWTWENVIQPAMATMDAANEWVINSAGGGLTLQGMGRRASGDVQRAAEVAEDTKRMETLVMRYHATGDETLVPEIQALEARINATLAAMPGETPAERTLQAAQRNPNTPAVDMLTGTAQGIAATALAPSLGSGVVRNIAAAAIDPVGQAVGGALELPGRAIEALPAVARRAGELASDVGAGIGRGLADLAPATRMIQESGGGMREIKPTVEVLQEQLDWARSVIERARQAGDAALEKRAIDRAWELESALVDARNARTNLEPRIASDVGRRIETMPIDERTADDITGLGRERVAPDAAADLTQPSAVATDMRGRMNSALPFDPGSAALGAGAGAASEDENGDSGDPLRTTAGMFIAGLGNSRYGRRFVASAARNAQAGPPPNLWEIMQGFRFSWGMLGNLAQTGLVNVAGGPVELAKGLPTEAIRMSLLRGRPIGTAHYAAEVASGLQDGWRGLIATALGEIPSSVRNAPDFRQPMSERLASRMGQVGNVDTGAVIGEAVDLPGRLSSQAPDSLWRPLFLKAGAAKERNTMMAESGVSKLNPAAQWRELQRLVNNPTQAEAQRIADAAKAHADEMGLKGDAGFFERKLSDFMRGGRVATSADPMQAQIHEAVGSFVMPFLGAVYKLHKLAATGVPGVGMLANSKLPMDEKIARQVVGTAMMAYIADRAAQGLVTGPGPSDPDEAAIVNKKMPPHSSYFPGIGWVPNDSLSSAGPYLNAIGAYYDARRYATEKDKATPGKGDESAVKYVLRGFERFPVVQAVQSVIAMAESPIKGVSDFAANAASSFAPAPYRTYQGSQDQYARTVDREAGMDNGILPALGEQARQKVVSRVGYVPGLGAREDLQPALDRFGRPVENDRQGVSAFLPRVQNPKDDQLTNIFARAGIEPGMAPAEIDNIPLNTEQKREWLRVRGEWLVSKQDILNQNADAPEKRRKDVFDAQMQNAADRARVAVRRLFTPEQKANARKKAS